jgi:hypothetical protein
VLAFMILLGLGLVFAAIQVAGSNARPVVAADGNGVGKANRTATPSHANVEGEPAHHLVVIDFLGHAGEALASDPIDGSPDVEELVAIIGDPTAFGTAVTDQADAGADSSGRCGVADRAAIEALAMALNDRLPADQRMDPNRGESRSLLHWKAAEGFASVRIFARDRAGSPSCADAGKRF